MGDVIKLKGGTAAEWTAANPVLHEREVGVETDTRAMKVGDGVTAWNSLPYAISNIINPATQAALDAKADASAMTTALSGKVSTSQTVAGHALTGPVTVSKSDVGLGNVDNTSDVNKPVSTAQATAIGLKLDANQKAAASGVCELDSGSLVPVARLPLANSNQDGAMSAADKAKLDVAINVTLAAGQLIANLTGTTVAATLSQLAAISGLSIAGAQFCLAPFAGTLTVNWNNWNSQRPTRLASGANAITFANPQDGSTYSLRVLQPTSGAPGTLTLPSGTDGVTILSGSLSTTNSALNYVVLKYDYEMRQYYGVIS